MNDAAGRTPRTPPLYRALGEANLGGKDGMLGVTYGNVIASIVVSKGRVVDVVHPDATATAVVDLLTRSGSVPDRTVRRATKRARDRSLETVLVEMGVVSAGTLTNARDMLCRETVLDLMLRLDIDVSPAWNVPVGHVAERCTLPLAFLLKEAQRRATELAEIRRAVPAPDAVFVRAAGQSGAAEHWEDINLPGADKQVYFFLDGRRTVAEVALASCQPMFQVSRAIKHLVDAGLARIAEEPGRATVVPARTGIWRLLVLVILSLALGGGVVWGVLQGFSGVSPDGTVVEDDYHRLSAEASRQRLVAAIRLYTLIQGEAPKSVDDLLQARLVLPAERRTAAVYQGGYLMGKEGDGQTQP
jgi:3-methyladenine DNA glycosylase AlkC